MWGRQSEDNPELLTLIDSIEQIIDDHFPFIEQNYHNARKALDAARHSHVTGTELDEITSDLKYVLRSLDDDMIMATEAFKKIWEPMWP
ncbi:hypothetical protein [Subtercola sp. RTI3]|uniref:hypothetical protein n=1 Tax=Subtercola sp. RTI3 TaxID=3048639 RepID=UPI002B2357B1|nr:hypothetical protein [Subtercola sp. RTI3]MEA9986267.1 hypothetical protein [Subtercola sp. RTI3]